MVHGSIQELHSLIRNDTSYGVCTTDEERFATVQVRASTDKKGLKRIDTNRHRATRTYHYNQFVHTKTAYRV